MKIIDDTVFQALQHFYAACGTQQKMAEALHLSRGQISRLLHRRTASFEDKTWSRIAPLIEPHIKMGKACTSCSSCPKRGSCILQALIDDMFNIPPETQEAWYQDLHEYVLKNRAKYLPKVR